MPQIYYGLALSHLSLQSVWVALATLQVEMRAIVSILPTTELHLDTVGESQKTFLDSSHPFLLASSSKGFGGAGQRGETSDLLL